MERRGSQIALAESAMSQWKSSKVEINAHVQTLAKGTEADSVDCVTEIGIDQIKEDLYTHIHKLKGKTETLVRKKLKLYKRLVKQGQWPNTVVTIIHDLICR